MRKHKLKVHKANLNKPMNLAQIKSELNTGSEIDNMLENKIQVKAVASIKAPSDPKKLKLVQINNQKPLKHNTAPPKGRSLVQLDQQINIGEH